MESCLDSSSDHTPVLLTISNNVIFYNEAETIYRQFTDWLGFTKLMKENIQLQVSLKTPADIEEA